MTLPFELHSLIVFYAGLDQATLCTLCLVDSNFRDLAIRQLYSKLVFRKHAKIEEFFPGISVVETAESDSDREAELLQAVMQRRAREMSFVKEIELDLVQREHTVDREVIEVHPALIQSGPHPIDILRFDEHYRPKFLFPLFPILAPLRLVVSTSSGISALPHLSLSSSRPIVLDCFGPSSPQLAAIDRSFIRAVIWMAIPYPDELDYTYPSLILPLARHCPQLRLVMKNVATGEAARKLLRDLIKDGQLDGCDVQVSSKHGRRMERVEGKELVQDLLQEVGY